MADLVPYFAKDGIQIYCFDSSELIDDIAAMGALVLGDPPYGVNERTMRKSAGRSKLAECHDFPPVIGDDKPFDPTPWLVCERLVLWGANHYASRLPDASCWLTWDKREGQGSNDNADCELAWTNLGGPARLFSHLWNGAIKGSERQEQRVHPTQKPAKLMEWVIEQFTDEDDLIIDPFMGSGSTLLAAMTLGRRAIGIELSPEYCAVAKRRIENHMPLLAQAFPPTKRCGHCAKNYSVVPGITFNRKVSSPDGLQPWCRACDMRNKRGKHNGWTNFRRQIGDDERLYWTEEKYLSMMGDFHCATCGSDVTTWGGGYWVDRVSSKRGYIEGNCRPCCWGCNRLKSNRNPESAYQEIERQVAKYGRGQVPWDEIHPQIHHTENAIPDLSAYLASDGQLTLFGGGK